MSEGIATTLIACPNPRCSGSVHPDQPTCTICGHELAPCPNCGKLMSKTIGRCGRCGHRLAEKQAASITSAEAPKLERETVQPVVEPPPPPSVADGPIIVRFEGSRSSVKEIMAEAYQQVALADDDMAAAMRILEDARTSLLTEPDAFEIWRRLDEAIGAADANTLRSALIALRAWFQEQLFEQQRKRLSKPFERNPEVGWREWLRTYAEGLARWRLLLCRDLVDARFSFPEQFHKPHDFKHATQLILHDRWVEVHQFFAFMAGHEFLHPHTRARLLISVGQIHLYYFSPRDRALKFFQQAEQLAPALAEVLAALGDYYREQNDLLKSRTYLEQAMQVAPDVVDSYLYRGDLAEKQGNLEEARTWYQEAINKAVGDSSGYRRLLRLYGRPEFIERYESHIVPLAERAKAVDETAEYRIYLDVGAAYGASRRYETVYQWYDKAIQLEPNRLGGYIEKGFACLDEGEGSYDIGRAAFEAAIRVAPEAYDGYWGMGQLAEQLGQWPEAAKWYIQAKQRQPEFYSSFQSRIGEMYWKMEHFEKAETALLDALKHDSRNDAAVLNLADDYLKQRQPEKALRLFRQIREIKGETFEASYQNRVGNVYYYEKDYEKAVRHYLNAINSDDKEVVYFSNLSNAYWGLERWTDARDYLKKAYNLHGDRKEYEKQLARVYNAQVQALEKSLPTAANGLKALDETIAAIQADLQQAQGTEQFSEQLARLEQMRMFVARYGTNALTFEPTDKPIRVHVASNMMSFMLKANQTDLSEDFLSLIDAMRQRLHKQYGLQIPGLTFRKLVEPGIPSETYRIEVMDERVADGRLESDEGNDLHKQLLKHIERILSDHLDRLCGHQETANLLKVCYTDDCDQISSDPHKLSLLTRRLKDILRQRESIANLAPIAADVNRQASRDTHITHSLRLEQLAQELAPGVTSLTLYLNPASLLNRANLTGQFQNLQTRLFKELGIVMPQVTFADSTSIGQHDCQLQINDEKLPVTPNRAWGEIWVSIAFETELRRRPDQLLTRDLVEYYLTKLKTNFPALVNVVRHYFTTEELTQQLRHRLSLQSSIRNLPKILEELVSAASDVT
jgi:tetratricopeptide (TPR) repeat protein/predicted RNA-binding Zn-ribbon protein involved in translation (DUF1610 family)